MPYKPIYDILYRRIKEKNQGGIFMSQKIFSKYALIMKKILIIIIGSIISAYGIDLAIHAGFGGATLAILWQGIAKTFHISIGQASLIIAAAMILFCFFFDRKQIHVGTLLYQVIYSSFVDIFADKLVYSSHRTVNFLLMAAGIAIFSIGTGLYSYADYGRGSYEAFTFAMADKFHWEIKNMRIAQDILIVILGVLLGGSIGLCTLVAITLSGYLMQKTICILQTHAPLTRDSG